MLEPLSSKLKALGSSPALQQQQEKVLSLTIKSIYLSVLQRQVFGAELCPPVVYDYLPSQTAPSSQAQLGLLTRDNHG